MQIATEPQENRDPLIPLGKLHAPGRVNLIGEHTDYSGGKVLPFAIHLGLTIELSVSGDEVPRMDSVYEVTSKGQEGVFTVTARELDLLVTEMAGAPRTEDMRPALPGKIASSWARYAVGALAWHWHAGTLHGWRKKTAKVTRLDISSDLPIGAGVSSSAAFCTGILALLARREMLPLDRQDLARQAMYVEHQFAGARCGLMDQLAVALAEKDSLLLIDFKDFPALDKVVTRNVVPHAAFHDYVPVLLDTKVRHELGASPYNDRRRACEEGLQLLCRATGKDYPSLGHFSADKTFIATYAPDGHQMSMVRSLEDRVFRDRRSLARRVAHAIMENLRVDIAVGAIENGDLGTFMEAINTSHQSLSRDYEVSCDELDLMRATARHVGEELAQERKLKGTPVLGARLTGGGFGGSTIQMVHQSIVKDFAARVVAPESPYVQETGTTPQAIVTKFSQGLTFG